MLACTKISRVYRVEGCSKMKYKMGNVDSELFAHIKHEDEEETGSFNKEEEEEEEEEELFDKNKLPDNLRKFRDVMEKLIDMVVAVKDEKFSVSKNMILAICVILEMRSTKAEDAWRRLPEQLTSSGVFIDALKELKAMCADPQCKDVLDGAQARYVVSCRMIAGFYADRVHTETAGKALLFRQQNQGVLPRDKENELESENKAAKVKRTEVLKFCEKYRYKI